MCHILASFPSTFGVCMQENIQFRLENIRKRRRRRKEYSTAPSKWDNKINFLFLRLNLLTKFIRCECVRACVVYTLFAHFHCLFCPYFDTIFSALSLSRQTLSSSFVIYANNTLYASSCVCMWVCLSRVWELNINKCRGLWHSLKASFSRRERKLSSFRTQFCILISIKWTSYDKIYQAKKKYFCCCFCFETLFF